VILPTLRYTWDVFPYRNYQIPIDLLNLTGGGPDTFGPISESHMGLLAAYTPVRSEDRVLEIGCGIGRDAIPLTDVLVRGSYVGVDIIRASIDWCNSNIARLHPNFRFVHFDVHDQLHNPTGTVHTSEIVLPVGDMSIDRVIVQSVFTHMDEPDTTHYLREFRRVMAPGAMALVTFFIVSAPILDRARSNPERTPFHLTFEHEYGEGCWITDPEHPMGAVAYSSEALARMVLAAGFYDYRIVRGNWSGAIGQSSEGQDLVVLYAR
jgi:SAM-dependent methyltransferase